MFQTLSDKLQSVFRNLRGFGKLSEKNIADALREVRLALLEADVNYKVAKDFIESVKTKSLGQTVLDSITPGQQVIKIIYDELVALMGAQHAGLQLNKSPAAVLLCGLHGCGKTTTAGKLARLLTKQGQRPLLAACDVYRPAAVTQLQTLGKQLNIPVHAAPGESDVLKIARGAMEAAAAQSNSPVIFDTAGRLQIDEPLIQELVHLKQLVAPAEILLVADAATGQQAVDIASRFDHALGLTGIILTKLDGDTRGGAALAMRAVTGKPIKLVGVGEKLEDLEPFHPDRMASRILGMGDVVSLVEKAQESFDAAQAEKMQEKLRKADVNLEDFLAQMQQMKKMGPLENLLGMLPGMSNIRDLSVEEKQLKRLEAIIQSMTPAERRRPEVIDGRRRQRIARGSGTTVADVNQLLKQFWAMRNLMKEMPRLSRKMARLGRLKMPTP
ncbi:MAG: signal recognition particle protein [Verrucomicrobia bacterium]|nr:signal recognition particle protein [Verrucomicrobiota bacterium]